MVETRIGMTNNWSVEYDGRSILDFMLEREMCTLKHARMVIENEGGYITPDGIIHRGTAENKLFEIEKRR